MPLKQNRLTKAEGASAVDHLLDVASRLVDEGGLSSLSLRALAEAAGVTAPTVTHHLGAKEDLLDRFIEFSCQSDLASLKPWQQRASLLSAPSQSKRAEFVVMAAEQYLRSNPQTKAGLSEALAAANGRSAWRKSITHWYKEQLNAWTEITRDPGLATILVYYFVDEMAFGTALHTIENYCFLRSLCLRRLILGVPDAPEQAYDSALFQEVLETLKPTFSVADQYDDKRDVKKLKHARYVAEFIISQGAHDLTHRAVAAGAGVSASTLSYHYTTREDLIIGGLSAIIHDVLNWGRERGGRTVPSEQEEFDSTRPVIRGTNAIALAARAYPGIIPHAADMRRRRGITIQGRHLPQFRSNVQQSFAGLSAQSFSCMMFGSRILAMALGESEKDHMEKAIEALARHW